MSRRLLAGLAAVAALSLSACGSSAAPAKSTAAVRTPAAPPAPVAPSASASPSASPSAAAPPSPPPVQPTGEYVFPVVGNASYAHTHHDYPATDIIAACGLTVVSPVDGTVLEVTRVDAWTKMVNSGASRGGLSVSILGADGARYYLSHFSSVDAGIDPGVRLSAGQPIAKVGRTGHAGACHTHFGLSPACARTGDWWTRRGVLYPWPYLDAWRAHKAVSPAADLAAWQAQHGCPEKATIDP